MTTPTTGGGRGQQDGLPPPLAVWLRAERLRRGWTLAAAARRCGTSVPLVSHYERGERGTRPPHATLLKLAAGYGVPAEELAALTGVTLPVPGEPPADVAEVVAVLRRLHPDDRAAVLTLARSLARRAASERVVPTAPAGPSPSTATAPDGRPGHRRARKGTMSRTARTALAAVGVAVVAASGPAGAVDLSTGESVRIDGVYGAVQLDRDRLYAVVDQVANAADPEAALLALPRRSEQVAVLYAFNPFGVTDVAGLPETAMSAVRSALSLVTDLPVSDDCTAKPRECAEHAQSPSTPEGSYEQRDPDTAPTTDPARPNAKPYSHVVEVLSEGLLGNDLWTFRQVTSYGYDGRNITAVDGYADYDVHYAFWECQQSEVPEMPKTTETPPAPAAVVDVVSVGHCTYRIEVSVFGKTITGTLQHAYPNIHVKYAGTGEKVTVTWGT